MKNSQYEVLVVGIGNILMTDDGLGVHVVTKLKEKVWPPGVQILEAGISPMFFLEEISLSRNVIAVDAVRAGGKPGMIYRLDLREIKKPPDSWRNSHGLSLPDIVELAREMTRLPAHVIIYGVEPQELSFGYGFSPPVKKALPVLIEKAATEINHLLVQAKRNPH